MDNAVHIGSHAFRNCHQACRRPLRTATSAMQPPSDWQVPRVTTHPRARTRSQGQGPISGTPPTDFNSPYTTLTGDGSIVTQVTSMANFVNSGKAGIMMRNSLDPSSAYAIAFLTPQGTVNFEERASSGASSASRASQGTFSTPEWLKVTRSGNAFSVFYSANGTSWTQLGSSFHNLDG